MKYKIHNCETGIVEEIELTAEQEQAHWDDARARAWHRLREERDLRLQSTDWTVLSDSPASTAAWKTYRQALRDLPANTPDPLNPTWPIPPK